MASINTIVKRKQYLWLGDCGCRYSLRDWWGTVSV